MADHGWWLPEAPGAEEDGLYGVFELNVNKLLPSYAPGRSGFGANYKAVLCRVRKVEDDDQHHCQSQCIEVGPIDELACKVEAKKKLVLFN